jgi:hypothetical protein
VLDGNTPGDLFAPFGPGPFPTLLPIVFRTAAFDWLDATLG